MRRWVALVVVVLAGCSHGNGYHSDQTTAWNGEGTRLAADYICHHYVPGHIVSSWVTTVGHFRETTIGTGGPQLNRFPKLSPSTAAAWCWTGRPGAYNVYEVASDGEVQKVVGNLGGVAPADAHGTPPPVP